VFISDESIVHFIDPTRSTQVIDEHLGTVISGILLVDRYAAYKSFAKKHERIVLAFCWAHARRDFREAGLKNPQVRQWAQSWEERINELFHLNTLRVQRAEGSKVLAREDSLVRAAVARIQQATAEELKQPRLHHSQKSVLKRLENHWDGLTVFVEHPEIPMDNTLRTYGSERRLRNPVVGRKNYYGSGTIWHARFTVVMFSIFETLDLWQINQNDWQQRYNYRLVLLETFVEKKLFSGTCYKAANWINVGTTKGRGRGDRFNEARLPKKDIFVFPMDKDFHNMLC